MLYVYSFQIAPISWSTKIAWQGVVSADETRKFHDQLDCLHVALNDHQIQMSHVILFQNELHFRGKRVETKCMEGWDIVLSICMHIYRRTKIKIIKQAQGNMRKTNSLTWRKHNQEYTRKFSWFVRKCFSWQATASRLRKGIKTSYRPTVSDRILVTVFTPCFFVRSSKNSF